MRNDETRMRNDESNPNAERRARALGNDSIKMKTPFRLLAFASVAVAVGVVVFALVFHPEVGVRSWVGACFVGCGGLAALFAAVDVLTSNEAVGDFWTVSRTKHPLSYWFSVVAMFAFAGALFWLAWNLASTSNLP